MNKIYKTVEDFINSIIPAYFIKNGTIKQNAIKEGWQARQAEINELKSRISELEKVNKEWQDLYDETNK